MKPHRLRKGDKLAVLSPSWGGPSVFPHVFNNGVKYLEEILGLVVKEFPTTRMTDTDLHGSPEIRAKDINDAFADPEVKGIIASIGGDDSIRILKYLDKDIIISNPKLFMGYSDTTTLLTLLNQWGLVTFHGPSVMAGFSQGHSLPTNWYKHVEEVIFEDKSEYKLPLFDWYSEGYSDWSDEENTGKIKAEVTNHGYQVLQGSGIVEGVTFGGNIEIFEFMKSTDYYPDTNFWKDKIVFFETSEDVPSVTNVKYFLRNYGIQGLFSNVKAILFGRCRDYTNEMKKEFNNMLITVIREEFGATDLPIMTELDFGHTDPQWILPLGIKMKVDLDKKKLSLLESPFINPS